MPQLTDRSYQILELAVSRVVERLKYLEENGSFTPNDGWTLGYLEMALELAEQIRKESILQYADPRQSTDIYNHLARSGLTRPE